MTKKIAVIFSAIILIFFSSCNSAITKNNKNTDDPNDQQINLSDGLFDDLSDNKEEKSVWNDLVHRDYDSAINISENTVMIINTLDIGDIKDSDITIVIINNSDNCVQEVLDYEYNRESISYAIKTSGFYSIYAVVKNNGEEEVIDLSGKISFETGYKINNNNFIFLEQ